MKNVNKYYLGEMEKRELQDKAWWAWESEQSEKYDGEVEIAVTMEPIPWHSSNSRRYNIYNNADIDIIIDAELVTMDDGTYSVEEY